jgi:hypothetical protein
VRWGVVLFWLVALAVAAPSAGAARFEIAPGGFAVRALGADGQPEGRAGAHPDRFQIDFELDAEETTVRDIAFELPPGFGGSSGSVPLCPRDLFEKGEEECPQESRVGTVVFRLSGGGDFTLPIFELEPRPDELIAFGSSPAFESPLRMELRPDDLGLTLEASDLPKAAVDEGRIELWGVPADHQAGQPIPRRPFLTMPTRCGSLDFVFRARSWEPDAPWLSAGAQAEAPLHGCETLAFEPQLDLTLTSPLADSPTGARIELSMQENDDPDGLAVAQVRDALISLPEGLTVSPGGAAGVTACSDAQLGLGNGAPASCPPSSRVGSVEIETPALPQPLIGDIYLGGERPGERFRLFIVASRQDAVAKFASTLRADPTTGRLSAELEGLPQLPLRRLTLSLDGGERALLATPLTCGSFPSRAAFVSHGGSTFASAVSVAIATGAGGAQCPAATPFSPSLDVVSTSRRAGRPTSLSLTLRRRPGEQLARRFAVSLPRGLSAALGEVEPCPDAAAATGACPAASDLGDAFAAVGSGSSPLSLRGDVYAAGPYRGAPFSLVLALDAAIGPFDLGSTATRAALQIHPRTARVTVVTDPLPSLIEGIPVRLQSIGLSLDRPGAVRNPTSCAPAAFDATVEAGSGATATLVREIAVSGCRRLGFKPRLAVALSGRSQMKEGGRPGLRISARMRHQDARLRALRISLPAALRFRLSGLGELCPRRDAHDGLCTARARVGTALARTPLLDRELRGSVYVVQPAGDGLPDLWVSVAAAGMRMSLQGRTSQRDGRFVANLTGLPDMPLSSFSMRLRGGGKGALSLAVAPCGDGGARSLASPVVAKGQNGAVRKLRLRAKAPCGAAG